MPEGKVVKLLFYRDDAKKIQMMIGVQRVDQDISDFDASDVQSSERKREAT